MMNEKIIALETKIAFQEEALQALNEVVTQQQQEIAALKQGLAQLTEQLKQLSPSNIATESEETHPPHY